MQTTYLVTGATDGIGKALALALAARGARVIMHGRSAAKLAAAVAEVAAAAPADAEVLSVLADFAVLDEVAALAATVSQRFPEVSVLINNAGLLTDHRQVTHDGFELTLGVNYLAPYLLTRLLVPLLQGNGGPARIVNVASTAMGGGVIALDDLQLTQGFSGWQAYANSKLANVMFSFHLATMLDPAAVVTNALCPGLIDTNFFHTNEVFGGGAYERLRPGMRSPEEGALVPLYLATDAAAVRHHGQFFVRDGRNGRRAVPLALDATLAAELWAHSAGLVSPWLGG